MFNSISVTLIRLYRPPHSKQNKNTNNIMFLDQFSDFLYSLSDGIGEIIVILIGDFNFHFDNQHASEAS